MRVLYKTPGLTKAVAIHSVVSFLLFLWRDLLLHSGGMSPPMVFLVFAIGNERYVLESRQVVEVVPRVELWQVPKAPAYCAGVFIYRGTLVPVLDLCQLMHSRPCPPRLSTRIILVHYRGDDGPRHVLGLMAEHVTDTMTREPTDFAPLGMTVKDAPYLGDILTDEHGMLQRVRLEHLLPASVRATLFTELGA